MQALESPTVAPLVTSNDAAQQKRKRMFKILGIVVAICAITFFLYWLLVASRHVSTNNAYTAADIAQVASATGGTVKTINVVDTQAVKAGDVLVTLDDQDADLVLREAQATVARTQSELKRAQMNYDRRTKLASTGYLSTEELNNAETMLNTATANLQSANVKLEQARIDLDRITIHAPIDGIVAKREVQLGQRIGTGTYLLSIIPVSKIYVNANFKEGQLTKVRIGQPVLIHADIYGSSVTYRGRVAGIAGGTGASFSTIPAQNATGNWIKVVQRVPVRIVLDEDNLQHYPLQVGLSMNVDINISQRA